VILDAHEQPLVTDFGLAPLRRPRPDGVTVVVPECNAAYTAPELVTGGPPTATADRYAYATIAYELLTGRTPFHGEHRDVLNAVLDSEPPAPSSVDRRLTVALDAVLLRGLARDPRARWRSCTEMVDALAAALSAAGPAPEGDRPALVPRSPVQPGPAGPASGEPGRGRSRRLLALGGGLVVALLAVGAAVVWLDVQPPPVVIGLSSTTVRVGDSLVVTATNVPPSQAGAIELHSDPQRIGSFEADEHGSVSAEVVIPQDVTLGNHLVTLCWDDGCHGRAVITILRGDAPSVTPGSPAAAAPPAAVPSGPAGPAVARVEAAVRRPASGPGWPSAGPEPIAGPGSTPAATTRPMPSHRASPRPTRPPRPRPSTRPRPSPSQPPSPSPTASPAVLPWPY
jgi:hypothetical protein